MIFTVIIYDPDGEILYRADHNGLSGKHKVYLMRSVESEGVLLDGYILEPMIRQLNETGNENSAHLS